MKKNRGGETARGNGRVGRGGIGRRGLESEMRDLLAEAESREMQAGPDLP